MYGIQYGELIIGPKCSKHKRGLNRARDLGVL